MEEAFLRAGVDVDFESFFVRPGDVQARGEMHDAGGAESAARLAVGLVFRGIPVIRDAAALGVDRDEGHVPFGGRDHAPAPLVVDEGDPIAGEVDNGGGLGGGRRTLRAHAAWASLRLCDARYEQRQRDCARQQRRAPKGHRFSSEYFGEVFVVFLINWVNWV